MLFLCFIFVLGIFLLTEKYNSFFLEFLATSQKESKQEKTHVTLFLVERLFSDVVLF